jgi:dTDP-4-amino-4,6-dideoxygalactose transaminase
MTGPSIPVSEVLIGAEEEALVLEVLRSGHLAQGPKVEALEAQFRERCGTAHAVAVSSGTTALVAALSALGVGPGDEVVTAPFTFAATLNAILEVGATARFADVDARDFTITADAVEAVVTDRTRVLMPVHLYGQPADMDAIAALATRIGASVIEDAAQAHGARVGTRSVGSFGIGCFSLYATKNVTTGEGGMVTTDDDDVAAELRILRNQGMRARYEYLRPGHNWRLTDLQAAVGIPQMRRLDELIAARRRNADRLDAGLAGVPGLLTPARATGRTHVFHQYTVRIGPDAVVDRDELGARLGQRGIGSGVYYPRLVHDYPCYRDRPDVVLDPTPEAARAAAEVLSLPIHPGVDVADLDRIVDTVRSVLGS